MKLQVVIARHGMDLWSSRPFEIRAEPGAWLEVRPAREDQARIADAIGTDIAAEAGLSVRVRIVEM